MTEELNLNDERTFLEDHHPWLRDSWRLACLEECDERTSGKLGHTALRDKIREVYDLEISNTGPVREAIQAYRKDRFQVSPNLLKRIQSQRPRAAEIFEKWLESQRKRKGGGHE